MIVKILANWSIGQLQRDMDEQWYGLVKQWMAIPVLGKARGRAGDEDGGGNGNGDGDGDRNVDGAEDGAGEDGDRTHQTFDWRGP